MANRKEINPYRFRGFYERIAAIKIDVTHKIHQRTETPENEDTFFCLALLKWTQLNCTLHFQDFSCKVKEHVKSLAQLVYHKEKVMELLKEHLQDPEGLALEPLLDLVVQLARDLEGDFYPYFSDFFKVFLSLLSRFSQDVTVLECIFTTLGYLFKFLWRNMVKDIRNVFSWYSPLLVGEQKYYIRQFAAESCSFVMRKTKDTGQLFDIIFSGLDTRPDLSEGLGLLCFEMLKGVKKQFHSMTDVILPVLFSKLGTFQKNAAGCSVKMLRSELVYKSLVHMLERMAQHTVRKHCQVVENTLIQEQERLWSIYGENQTHSDQQESLRSQIAFVLKLMDVWVSWNSGRLISDPAKMFCVLQEMFSRDFLSNPVIFPLLKLASSLLLASFSKLPRDEHHKALTLRVFNTTSDLESLFTFCRHLLPWQDFNKDVLPLLFIRCQSELLKGRSHFREVVQMLTEVILHTCTVDVSGLQLGNIQGLLFFPKCGSKQGAEILEAFLDNLTVQSDVLVENSQLSLIWGTVLCLSCISPLDIARCCEKLLELIHSVTEQLLSSDKETRNSAACLSMLSQAIQSYCWLVSREEQLTILLDYNFAQKLVSSWPDNVFVLQACYKLVTVARKQGIQSFLAAGNLQEIYGYARLNLCSASHVTRLLTLKILACFDQEEKAPSSTQGSLFQLCVEAEEIPAHFETYRDRLACLQKLRFIRAYYDTMPEFCLEATLLYLFGMLYVNLNLLWDPVIEIISSFTQGSNKKLFWKVYSERLIAAAEKTEKEVNQDSAVHEQAAIRYSELAGTKPVKTLDDIFAWLNSDSLGPRQENRADHANFRYLLWKAMASFPEVAEQNSRDVVPLFLRFVSNEYFVANESSAPSQDIRAKHSSDLQEVPPTNEINQSELEAPQAENPSTEPQNIVYRKSHRAAAKSLCIHLSLFTAFKGPKSLFKEPELRQLYMRFLTQKESEVQKLAVKCLMTYKFNYLQPYKENVERLLEDENFREELAHFSVDEERGIVDSNHREGLMPILIRLLYGKMKRWTGTGTGGKAGVGTRRSVVLRFLASCPQHEMQIFMDLILAPFKHLYTVDNPGLIITTKDLSNVVPLKKQLGFFGMVSEILNKLGEQDVASSFHSPILQIMLSLLSTCVLALEQRDMVLPHLISQLKTIRQLSINRLTEFFELELDFDIRPICDVLFSSAVWPQIEKLHQESIQRPTALLRLLFAWSKNSRFFPLLSRKPVENPNLSIMSCVFACLRVPLVSAEVVAMVMEMTDNLLSIVAEEEIDFLECGSELELPTDYSQKNRPTYGTMLVLPHLSEILEYLNRTVKQAVENKGKNKGKLVLPSRELSVLSKISPFVKDAQQSTTLLEVLIPLLNSSQKEESANNILSTVKGLLANVDSPRKIAMLLSKLFSQINFRSTRQCLCEVFLELANVDVSFSLKSSELLGQLNSWNPKRLEEPDYDTRLSAFANARALLEQGALKTEEILPLLHNSVYFVLNSDDLSLRDSAGNCISCIVRHVVQRKAEKDDAFHVLIMKNLLPMCKKGLASKKEVARNEFLTLLSTMVREFNHDSMSDLKVLLDEDPEKDFFENIKHIQLHRRNRALRRLQSHCQQHALRTTTLTSFLLPLVTHCIFDHTAPKEHNTVTEAITTIGVISASLPWSKYCSLLRRYLKLLPVEKQFQKVIVRIVVAILNNFHFDLSSVPIQVESTKTTTSYAEKKRLRENVNAADEKAGGDRKDQSHDGADESNDGSVQMESGENDDHEDDDDDNDDLAKGNTTDASNKDLPLRIYNTITTTILPQLRKYITKKRKSDSFHRLSQMKAEDEEEVLRVPIILAAVKLLQALPERALHLHLPGLLMRVCLTLTSRASDVRTAARDTLAKIMISLGIKYFPFMLKELRSSLKRGYQLHVLSFTLHTLLDKMNDNLSPGDLDPTLKGLVEVLIEDLFGAAATNREVEKIANKLPEAKTCKSYDAFEILGKFAGTRSLTLLVSPLKAVLDSTQSHKTAHRVEEVLRRISVGLQSNQNMTPPVQLIFIHGLASENMPLMKPKPVKRTAAPETNNPRLHPENSLLLPPNPTRGGNVPQTSTKTNHHIVVEFGLQMLYMMLKHGKLSTSDQEHLQMLDPFVELLTGCLESKYNKVVTISLRCVSGLVKFPLPSLTRCVPKIGKNLFKLLKNYAKAGAKVGENFEMVLSAFKAMTVIIRDFKHFKVAEKHLQVLLGFVEEDIHDHTKQGTAFSLLKAILSRKLIVPEIHDVMGKVGQLSITSSSPNIQLQSRQCMLQFLLDYPLGKKLQRYLEFYVSQLGYEHETGRESALEMLASMFSSFPETMLAEYAGFFFVPLTFHMVNDDSANCRKVTALTIKSLLEKLDADQRNKLFSIVLLWFKDDKVSLQRLAAQVCGLFVEVEGKNFERKLVTLLPIISNAIAPEQVETEESVEDEESHGNSQVSQRTKDHLLFNALSLLAKIIKECNVIKNPGRQQEMETIWVSVEGHLLHAHSWIRLVSSRLLGLLFAACKAEELVIGFQSGKTSVNYLQEDLPGKVAKLCRDMCTQLRSPLLDNELGEQIVKNLVFLAKILQILHTEDDPGTKNYREDTAATKENGNRREDLTLKDVLYNVNKLATLEASKTPKQTQKRSCVLRLMAAISVHFGKDGIEPYLVDILRPIYRELEIPATFKDSDLKALAQEALALIKSLVGRETLSQSYSILRKAASQTRETRKRRQALEAVADPAKSARKKVKKNLAKKVSRKRKIDSYRPERRLKAPRMQET
ncbi:small subunit processome component 20 homolog [Montipora capricornis]|uniref:small subunit processome component 20 homolog n=1 Tax=Montipora capricornis TaxID=246305 RepID=UPI0035F10E48